MVNKKSKLGLETSAVDRGMQSPEDLRIQTEALFGKLVKHINEKISCGDKYEQVLDFIFESLFPLIPYDRIGIGLIDDSGEVIKLHWVRSKGTVTHLAQDYSAPLKEKGSLRHILETGTPRIINNLAKYALEHPDSESTRLAIADGISSSLTCPLITNNKPIGIVFFSSFNENTYEYHHVEVFCSIANELAVIIEQERLRHFFSDNAEMVQAFKTTIHDLRAPLSVVQNYIEFALDEDWFKALGPEAREIFSTLHRNWTAGV